MPDEILSQEEIDAIIEAEQTSRGDMISLDEMKRRLQEDDDLVSGGLFSGD